MVVGDEIKLKLIKVAESIETAQWWFRASTIIFPSSSLSSSWHRHLLKQQW